MAEDQTDAAQIPEGENVVAHTLSCRAEADIIEDALKAEDIPVMVQTFESAAFDGVTTTGQGWGNVQVLEKDLERARKIIADVLAGVAENAEETPDE